MPRSETNQWDQVDVRANNNNPENRWTGTPPHKRRATMTENAENRWQKCSSNIKISVWKDWSYSHEPISSSYPSYNEFRQFPKMTIDPGLSTLLPIKIDSEQSLRAWWEQSLRAMVKYITVLFVPEVSIARAGERVSLIKVWINLIASQTTKNLALS